MLPLMQYMAITEMTISILGDDSLFDQEPINGLHQTNFSLTSEQKKERQLQTY